MSDGLHVLTPTSGCVLKCGGKPYWHADFNGLLQDAGRLDDGSDSVFPSVAAATDGEVTYVQMDAAGNDVLGWSTSLKRHEIPRRCLKSLQRAIDRMHAWAEDPGVPYEKRAFCREFRLPDPKKCPEAYRLAGHGFSRRLYVLWGYEKEGTAAFLPSSRISAKWEDAGERRDVAQTCRNGLWRRMFRPRNLFLAMLAASAACFEFLVPATCPVHQCVVGYGSRLFADAESHCPLRCGRSGCGRHLDADGKCAAHECRSCGREMPTTEIGICDDCLGGYAKRLIGELNTAGESLRRREDELAKERQKSEDLETRNAALKSERDGLDAEGVKLKDELAKERRKSEDLDAETAWLKGELAKERQKAGNLETRNGELKARNEADRALARESDERYWELLRMYNSLKADYNTRIYWLGDENANRRIAKVEGEYNALLEKYNALVHGDVRKHNALVHGGGDLEK